MSNSDLAASPAFAFETIDRFSRAHYRGLTADELLARQNTPLGQRQYARLIGVMLKEPFADNITRPPSKSTQAVVALHWKDDATLRQLAPGTWQFSMVRALIESEQGSAHLTDGEALAHFTNYKYETGLAKFILQAFRKRICADSDGSKKLRTALAEAKKAGVVLTNPTTAHLSVGIASTVAVTVATLMPPAVAAVGAPVIGGIALLLIQIGVDGFCAWSKQAIKEVNDTVGTEESE